MCPRVCQKSWFPRRRPSREDCFIFQCFTTQVTWLRIDNDTSPARKKINQARLISLFPSASSKVRKTIPPTVALTLTKGCTRPPFRLMNYLQQRSTKEKKGHPRSRGTPPSRPKFEGGWQAKTTQNGLPLTFPLPFISLTTFLSLFVTALPR